MNEQESELYEQRQYFLWLNGLDEESEMLYQAELMRIEESEQ